MEAVKCTTCNAVMQSQQFYSRSKHPPIEGTQNICPNCLDRARSIALAPPQSASQPSDTVSV